MARMQTQRGKPELLAIPFYAVWAIINIPTWPWFGDRSIIATVAFLTPLFGVGPASRLLFEKPSCCARVRPRWRAVTMSWSDWIGTRVSSFNGDKPHTDGRSALGADR